MDRSRLLAYAKLIVQKGINPDKGQFVTIIAGLDQPEFTEKVVEECYRCGAGKVFVDWEYMPTARLDAVWQTEEAMSALEDWQISKLKWRSEKLPALIWLDSDDPDGMNGTDQGKRTRAKAAQYPVIKPFREAMENKYQWCIAGVPGKKWALKVFPGIPENEAVEKLWEAILAAAHANGDPIANWNEHNRIIHERSKKLNDFNFAALEYKAPNGTDFTVELIPDGRFCGGSETDLSGRVFNPNIPSEEIFTTPMSGKCEGTLVSTKPLSWMGEMIENFSLRFENGRAVEVKAEKGEEMLKKMIAMDEGAAKLGECALIASSSPINQSGILFYNTLYDENASCHVALGRGFNDCIRDFEKYTNDELKSKGVNDSMIHVDFMIGSPELNITGICRDGKRIPVFRNGEWCF